MIDMKVSIELTLTPLNNNYKASIISFIKSLRDSNFKLIETPLSTQVYGEFDEVMPFVTDCIKQSFNESTSSMIHMKIINSDRNDYVADF